jgi:hypothetical protein
MKKLLALFIFINSTLAVASVAGMEHYFLKVIITTQDSLEIEGFVFENNFGYDLTTKIIRPTIYETVFVDHLKVSISALYTYDDSITIYSDVAILSKNKNSEPHYKFIGETNHIHKDEIKSITVYSEFNASNGSNIETELELDDLKWINNNDFESKGIGVADVCWYYIYTTDTTNFNKASNLIDELDKVIVPHTENNVSGEKERYIIFKENVRELKKYKILVASYCST